MARPARQQIGSVPALYPNAFRPNFPLIISGYTVTSMLGDYYKRASVRLSRSCIKFDLPHMIFPLTPQKGWCAGCSLKPALILYAIRKFQQPVLWIDADAEIFQYPKEFDNATFDMALHSASGHWLSGTLYISNKIEEFVKAWKRRTEENTPDEVTLLHTHRNWPNNERAPRLKMLDASYNTVVHKKTRTDKIVIGHYIRSDVAPVRGVEAVPLNEKF